MFTLSIDDFDGSQILASLMMNDVLRPTQLQRVDTVQLDVASSRLRSNLPG